nr:MAG TPA: hypothetical protein [Caudoviricetes sp.]
MQVLSSFVKNNFLIFIFPIDFHTKIQYNKLYD